MTGARGGGTWSDKREAGAGSSSRFRFNGVLAAIVAGFLLFATALTLKPFLPAILWAIVLAIAAAPLHGWIRRGTCPAGRGWRRC